MNTLATQTTIKDYLSNPEVNKRISELLKNRTGNFIVSLLSVVNSNEALKDCTPGSIVNAALTAVSLDLPVNQNLGYAYIIPFNDRKSGTIKAQFQMGAKGFTQLAQRSGQFKTINVSDVKQGEIIGKNRLSGEIEFKWIDSDTEREKAEVIGYVAYMRLINGFEKNLYMSKEELRQHGLRFSQTMKKGFGLWVDDFDSMAKKTVVKLLLARYAPLSIEMQKAQLADQAVIEDNDEYQYVENQPIVAEEVAADKEKERVLKYIENSKTVKELEKVSDHLTDDELVKKYEDKRKELE